MYSTLGNTLVIVGLLSSIPAVFYYTRVAIKMIVKDPSPIVEALPPSRRPMADSQFGPVVALILSLAGIIAVTTEVTPLMEFSKKAVSSLNQPVVGSLPSNLH